MSPDNGLGPFTLQQPFLLVLEQIRNDLPWLLQAWIDAKAASLVGKDTVEVCIRRLRPVSPIQQPEKSGTAKRGNWQW